MIFELYEAYKQPNVNRFLKKLKKRQKKRLESIDKAIMGLIEDPYIDSVPLVDSKFMGLRRVKAEKDRIIYQICSECRDLPAVREKRNCIDCDNIPVNAIKVFDILPRRSAY